MPERDVTIRCVWDPDLNDKSFKRMVAYMGSVRQKRGTVLSWTVLRSAKPSESSLSRRSRSSWWPEVGKSPERVSIFDQMGVGFVAGVFGFLILAHAAYSTVQYRGLLKIVEEEFSGPPLNVLAELLLGLVFSMWAALSVPGKFLCIHPDSEENRIVSLPGNLDFMIFNHRARALLQNGM